jgi:DNA-binding response OmpR family regulator
MKRIVFLSRSKLALNLMELIIPFVPKKAQVSGFSNVGEFEKAYFVKPVQLLVIDENFCDKNDVATLAKTIKKTTFKTARKIILIGKNSNSDRQRFLELDANHFHTKPFLPEELAEIIDRNLGSHK